MNSSSKAAPLTKDEAMLLVQLVAASKFINNKTTNAASNKLKDNAWAMLTNEFNSSICSFPRTTAQLKLKWDNLKKAARKRCANIRSSFNQTGGGRTYIPPDEVLEKVATLLGTTCTGLTAEFGGDSVNSLEIDIETANEAINAEGPVNGVCIPEGEVIKDCEITETPPPKPNTIFLNKASGSSNLAKRRIKMEEDKCKAYISRENALTEYLVAKRKKIYLENEEKELVINNLKINLENARLENLKLQSHLNNLTNS